MPSLLSARTCFIPARPACIVNTDPIASRSIRFQYHMRLLSPPHLRPRPDCLRLLRHAKELRVVGAPFSVRLGRFPAMFQGGSIKLPSLLVTTVSNSVRGLTARSLQSNLTGQQVTMHLSLPPYVQYDFWRLRMINTGDGRPGPHVSMCEVLRSPLCTVCADRLNISADFLSTDLEGCRKCCCALPKAAFSARSRLSPIAPLTVRVRPVRSSK